MGRSRWFIFIILLYLVFVPAAAAGTGMDPDHVLMLNSYNQRMTWVKDIVRGVEDVLNPENKNMVLHIANMDSKQFHSPEYFEAYKALLREKYRNHDFSLILSSDNNAFDFLMRHRDQLFKDVPLVFCGVNNFRDGQLKDKTGVTGVAEIFSAKKTVEAALSLHPGTREIYIVNDYLETGRAWEKDIRRDLAPFKKKVRLTYSGNLSMEGLRRQIAELGEKTIVLLGVYFSDKNGQYFTYEKVGQLISGASQVPVYCLLEFNMGKGVVGGQVISGYYQGKTMAEMGLQILKGKKADTIPVVKKGANRFVFDYLELERFGLNESSLPGPSLIINRPYSVFREYRKEVITLAVLISILIITIGALLVNRFRRIRAEEALVKSEQQLSTHLNNTPVGAVLWDTQLRVMEWNPAAQVIFGYTKEEALGKTAAELILPEELVPPIHELIQALKSGRGGERSINENIRKTGERITCDWYNTTLKNKEGRVTGVASLVNDITEQRKTRELMIQSEKMMSVGGLAAGMAHEINNPLAGMIQSAQVIHNRLTMDLPANIRAAGEAGVSMEGVKAFMEKREILMHLENITRTGTRAAGIVENMLSFVRKGNSSPRKCRLEDLMDKTLVLAENDYDLKKEYDFRQVNIIRDYAPGLPTVRCEESKIRQVLFNLIKNASQAVHRAGKKDPCIILRLGQEKDMARMEVEDNGPGMDDSVRKRVFEPFFTTKKVDKGTGLGLSISYFIIVDDHKGAMEVESTPGRGTKFIIKLPVSI